MGFPCIKAPNGTQTLAAAWVRIGTCKLPSSYSKTCLERTLKNRQNKGLKDRCYGSIMQVKSIAECSLGAFCNTFNLCYAIIGLENQFLVFFEWLLKKGFIVYEPKF